MKAGVKSVTVITGSILLSCLIFLLSPGPAHFINHPTNWEFREQLVYLTGACAMSLMVVSMLISARIAWVSHLMKGLDKGYIVHKWTGIFSAIFVVGHFLMENVPHWLVESGIINDPGELTDASHFTELEIALFQSGVTLVQPAFYIMIVIVVIALFKKIPYHWFRKSHRCFPVVFLIAAYHGATAQLKESWLGSSGSFLLILILLIGSAAAILSLSKNIGASRKVSATISNIEVHEDGILDLRLTTENNSFNYQPGQYAFLKFPHNDEPHPFSIASSDREREVLRFAIKRLGDFTSQLPEHLHIGQTVQIEGPYGEFQFNDHCEHQVWIAGGIGITPFMARLDYLANTQKKQSVNFFYSTRSNKDESFPLSLEQSCALSGVNFYHFNSTRKEYVTVDLIKSKVGNLRNTSIWFCGPAAFAECIQRGLKSSGFNMSHFHYDSFSMR